MPRRALALWIAAILSTGGPWSATAMPSAIAPSEYQVKAAFIYRFASYVQWPTASDADASRPFVIGILGEDPFGRDFDEVVRGQTVHGRRVSIDRFREIQRASQCDILFISASERPRLREIIAQLRGAPVLTVGDMDDFAERGGMISLTNEQKRIRFVINVGALERARLRAAAQLLRLATIVDDAAEDR